MNPLTHYELLAKIDSFSCCSGAHELALRAVVELHKPFELKRSIGKGFFACSTCVGVQPPSEEYPLRYPCPTIQAIEKGLE